MGPEHTSQESEPTNEHEPSINDVAAAVRQTVTELAPYANPEDLEIALGEIEAAVDLEEALGIAASALALLNVGEDAGLAMLGEILQLEEIRSNGDG